MPLNRPPIIPASRAAKVLHEEIISLGGTLVHLFAIPVTAPPDAAVFREYSLPSEERIMIAERPGGLVEVLQPLADVMEGGDNEEPRLKWCLEVVREAMIADDRFEIACAEASEHDEEASRRKMDVLEIIVKRAAAAVNSYPYEFGDNPGVDANTVITQLANGS